MCAIAKCNGTWVAIHGRSHKILAVGGRGKEGKKRAMAEAKKRQKKYGPPGRIPTVKEPNCSPMLKEGPAANRIRRNMRCVKEAGRSWKSQCKVGTIKEK